MMVEAARLSPSSRNIQPIKFYICNDQEKNSEIFPNLGWAGYLKDWEGPVEGERPGAIPAGGGRTHKYIYISVYSIEPAKH